jgi:hypothetical protein
VLMQGVKTWLSSQAADFFDTLTHSWSWALLENPRIMQPLKNFPEFYETRRFIRALHRSLSWPRSIQSIPSHHISLRFIFIFYTHLRLGLPGDLFPSGHQYPIRIPLLPVHATYPPHLILLDNTNYTWRRV